MRATRRNRSLRFLDRYAGIPLLSLFALAPRRAQPPRESVRRIGLLKSAAIGDTFLLAGPMRDLRAAFPDAALVFISGPDNRDAAAMLPVGIDEQIVVSPNAPFSALSAVRRARLDILIDFGSWPRFDAMLSALSGAGFRLGFRTAGQARHSAYDRSVEHSRDVHELENYRRLIRALGVPAESSPEISARGTLSRERMPESPFAVFHPWSGGYRHEVKEWPDSRWVELGRMLAPRHVVVTSGPGDTARTAALVAALRAAGSSASAGTFKLGELPDLFTASEVVVSVNTGVMHLAALVGARTVSVEGPVPVRRWGPVGPRVRSVESTYPDCGYLHLGFEYDGRRVDCMSGVSVSAVHTAIVELLALSS